MQRRAALTGPLRRPRRELRSGPERLFTLRGNAKAGASNARGLTFDETGRPPVAEVIGLPATASMSSYNRADHEAHAPRCSGLERNGGSGREAPRGRRPDGSTGRRHAGGTRRRLRRAAPDVRACQLSSRFLSAAVSAQSKLRRLRERRRLPPTRRARALDRLDLVATHDNHLALLPPWITHGHDEGDGRAATDEPVVLRLVAGTPPVRNR